MATHGIADFLDFKQMSIHIFAKTEGFWNNGGFKMTDISCCAIVVVNSCSLSVRSDAGECLSDDAVLLYKINGYVSNGCPRG